MTQIELNAEAREVLGKQVCRLRREGWVPAVIYGPGVKSRALQVRAADAEETVGHAGTSQLIALRVGKKRPVQALVRDLQRDPIRRDLLHIDFYQVEMSKSVTAEVPILLVGESPVIEQREGILLQGVQTVEIECLPGDLINAVEVDLGVLTEVDQQLTVADLAVPSTIRILSDPHEVVARVSPLSAVVEEEELELEEGEEEAEAEVLTERKEEEAEEDEE